MHGMRQAAVCAAALGLVLGLVLASPRASANPIADFYRGKQVNWILSAGEGGGYSSYARAFATHFGAHIPGNPKVVVQNMPGAGGIRAMNHLYSVAPKDGTVIGLVHSSVPFAPLYGTKGATFDPREMNWIGSLATEGAMCVAWHTSAVKTWQDLFDKEFVVGSSGAGSQMETLPLMLNKLFGTKVKVIPGYKGGNDVFLAMERGEVDGRCGGLVASIQSTRPEWFTQKKVNVPIRIAMKRSPLFPEAPALVEFAKDERTKQTLQLLFSAQGMDRPILAPPGVPAERVAALRAAFHKAINDPAFREEAAKQRIGVDEVSGDEVAEIIRTAYAMPPEIINGAKELMGPAAVGTE